MTRTTDFEQGESKKVNLDDVLKIVIAEKWFPMIKPTNFEMEASKILNKTLDTIEENLRKLAQE